MPNTSSASKRLRQNEKRRLLNRATRSNMRSTIRRVREAVENNDLETAKNEFKVAQKKLDRAAANNLIHKNAAARTKSRLNNLIKNAAQTA
ncbi:30S ribosomal protein S20 [Rhodopirellula baltica]|uniref:Small ribosomal subunit protein bS20 n=4 Tax=Rhodopirellula baltica TaxID=265606 RepID=RS20_RHOBA|nr:30S ribosomal protein S20 [Rhodopirellula baltica]Q7UPC9.1 RecName: Full=Small ribosomal subunit protein bS20; AltName: Full=30S ribosomal protein S20 [Rhodopirellula baltica SH 1]EGF27825.1 30S ribosomal protein S20 [Rhodopirellula baltica WH47]EKK02559.1 30S ribosomal protein S20 [Rhodopirellula baltica SH28]ELP35046.1 30S ribosomal protein S20 [Rhodopirellula baltica SWK14]CAD75133.1 probable 30S ribosomal protein S20 [Rhodopirellula baltica SH 1]HBE65011.1 30S ribosomal protein S20 [Rh